MKKTILLSLLFSGFLSQAQNANPLKEKVYYSVSEALNSDKKATQLNLRDQHIFCAFGVLADLRIRLVT